MESSRVTISQANADYAVGFSKGLVVAFWCHRTLAVYVPEIRAAADRAGALGGFPIGLLQLVPATAVVPDGAARTALSAMLRDLNGKVSCSSIVHEAEGFRAAVVRSIVTGVAAVSNPGFPHRVFGKVTEAATWMAQCSTFLSPPLVESTVARVRAAIVPSRPPANATIGR